MSFISPEPVPEQESAITNAPFWPDISLTAFRSAMRTDGTVTPDRLRQVAISAMSDVNRELEAFRVQQRQGGYQSLAAVPSEQIDGESARVQHYRHAVWCQARALLNERYQDFDATASGEKRGEALERATGELWRDVRWAISRVQDKPHCIVELI